MRYSRFVAIGDSQTEGMGDPHPISECRGWADRLAERMAALNPELRYANLAVRGKNARQSLAEQLDVALTMQPDLVAAPLGMNDVIGRADLRGQVRPVLDQIYGRLADSGATVVISTFPNIARSIPVVRGLEVRLLTLNDMMREFAQRYGFVLVDLHAAPVLTDLRAWSTDRLHASPLGHQRFAEGAAHALGLPGATEDWGEPLPPLPAPGRVLRTARDVNWAVQFFTPWVIRKIRGVSLGDGRMPKRPSLTPIYSVGDS